MVDTPTSAQLREVANISASYASMIISNDRAPARSLAILFFRKLGWRHPVIADLSDEQMAVLEQVEPWTPREAAAA